MRGTHWLASLLPFCLASLLGVGTASALPQTPARGAMRYVRERRLNARLLPRLVGVLFALATFLMPGRSVANLITNPSFEAVQILGRSPNPANVPGWTHGGLISDGGLLWAVGFSDLSGSITTAGEGRQFVTMGGGFTSVGTSSWSQTLTGLSAGTYYDLSFMIANEDNLGEPAGFTQSVTVSFLGGSDTLSQLFTTAAKNPTGNYWKNWETKYTEFHATGGDVTLQFLATTQFDVGLDNVFVPEASTVLLLGAGLVGLAGARRRCGQRLSPHSQANAS